MFKTRSSNRIRPGIPSGALALGVAASVGAQVPPLPKSPVTLNISDPAGDLALTQAAIDLYQKKHPELLSKVNIVRATAPERSAAFVHRRA